MTSLQSHTSTGTKPVISGNFSLASMYEKFLGNLDEHISNTLANISKEEELSFKNRLNETPDWKHTQESARVSLTKSSIDFSVDHEDAQDLEYGNPLTKKTASGLIRSQTRRRSEEVGTGLVDRIVEEALGA
jgi:hypothetical protein